MLRLLVHLIKQCLLIIALVLSLSLNRVKLSPCSLRLRTRIRIVVDCSASARHSLRLLAVLLRLNRSSIVNDL